MGAGRPRGLFGEKRGRALALIAAGHRQFEVAKQLGVTRQAIGYWRNGADVEVVEAADRSGHHAAVRSLIHAE
jgi:hypothetical protein